MSKLTMPEPVAWMHEEFDHTITDDNKRAASSTFSRYRYGLITTTQAEAYADARVAESQQWNPIETAPHETLVILGWYDENGVFKQEIALASAGRRYPGGTSDMWWHGLATHWMPLPDPPHPEPM